ncbi:hypothetical protein D1AOALGA4SA_8270 [Olavius algarvensis Delta 1 endosymbiont]|nr:hypothetical protein D1AOALGA4SA_8270 [Olavius algarvensis Delta 1 endosymbiont]
MFRCQVFRLQRTASAKTAGQVEIETKFVHRDKLQMTNTKLQTNLKSQYPITETHFPHGKGYRDLGSTIR